MSNNIAIRIEKLGKRYRYGGPAAASYNLRQDLTDWVKGMFNGRKAVVSSQSSTLLHHTTLHEVQEKHLAESPDHFWALRDINLEIKQGEVVGIIGRNGAGKSTLLKILSRITPPTTGNITYHGRMASLLEVGTGFHRELTGRENIFLNGSILGMKRSEIAKKFDEIVAFAEVEKFIDTPVKFYSSGMYVRLAFAVAAHLEPEILVVDEVLAVGDAEFQKKCLGKMDDVAKQGRTILFVSHHLPSIEALTSQTVLLQSGRMRFYGETSRALEVYLQSAGKHTGEKLSDITTRTGAGRIRFSSFRMTDCDGHSLKEALTGQSLAIYLEFTSATPKQKTRARVGIAISSALHVPLFIASTEMTMSFPPFIGDGDTLVCRIPKLPLGGGAYKVVLFMECNGVVEDWIENEIILQVVDRDYFGFGKNSPNGWEGRTVLVDHAWELKQSSH